jgi:hypothetical protein
LGERERHGLNEHDRQSAGREDGKEALHGDSSDSGDAAPGMTPRGGGYACGRVNHEE